ncbi:hypothetical protein OG21DRAFT_1525178 [Imleria badia]|nr:hypothetical protein OG21DRAFT_1525178 [Imleria badia]
MVLLTHKKAKEQEESEHLPENDGSTHAPLPMKVGPPAICRKGKPKDESEAQAAPSIIMQILKVGSRGAKKQQVKQAPIKAQRDDFIQAMEGPDPVACKADNMESTVPMREASDPLLKDLQRFVSPDADENEALRVLKGESEGTANTVPVIATISVQGSLTNTEDELDQLLAEEPVTMSPKIVNSEVLPSASPHTPRKLKAPCGSPLLPSSPLTELSPEKEQHIAAEDVQKEFRDRYFEKGKWRADEDEYTPERDTVEEGVVEEGTEYAPDMDPKKDEVEVEVEVEEEDKEDKEQKQHPGDVNEEDYEAAEERTECREFGLEVMEMVETLAEKLGRSTRNVLLKAGLVTHKACGPSLSNMHRAWLAQNEPKTTSVLQRVKNAAKQFGALAAAYSNVEDIEVLGAVLYIGPDDKGRKGAAFFEGSACAHFIVENFGVPAKNVLDMLETCFKYVILFFSP